jgi:hypothetical protein
MVWYWFLQSRAAAKALHQLIIAPHRWDKTLHAPRSGRPLGRGSGPHMP